MSILLWLYGLTLITKANVVFDKIQSVSSMITSHILILFPPIHYKKTETTCFNRRTIFEKSHNTLYNS